MSGAGLSEDRMHWMIEHIQTKVNSYLVATEKVDVSNGIFSPSPWETLREIRELIDLELARPHLILWRMMALYPEKEYKVTSVRSDIHRSIDDVPGGGVLEESVSINVEIIRI